MADISGEPVVYKIYKITHKDTGKCYVGKTKLSIKHRWTRHVVDARNKCHSNPHFRGAINKYGKDAFTIEELARTNSLDEINNLEKLWISVLHSDDPSIGYNLTAGGDGGTTPTQEVIDRIKASKKGKLTRSDVSSDEIVALYSEGYSIRQVGKKVGLSASGVKTRLKLLGVDRRPIHCKRKDTKRVVPISEETKKKIGDAQRGRVLPESQILHMKEAAKKNWADPEFKKRRSRELIEARRGV